MGSYLDKRMARLKARRADSPEYRLAQRELAGMSTDLAYNRQNINAKMGRYGESINAQIGAGLELDKSVRDIYSGVYNKAQDDMESRRGRIDEQIENTQTAIDAENERKRQEKAQKKNGLLKGVLQVGGMALGALIPGGSLLTNMAIGAGAGEMASGFVGGGGKMGTNYANPEEIMQGIGDTISGISAASTLNEHKQLIGEIGGILKNDLPLKDLEELRLLYDIGDIAELRKFILKQKNKYINNASPIDIDYRAEMGQWELYHRK